MTEYTVVTENTRFGLSNEVNDALSEGWQLHGGVSVATYERQDGLVGLVLAQALVRDVDDDATRREGDEHEG